MHKHIVIGLCRLVIFLGCFANVASAVSHTSAANPTLRIVCSTTQVADFTRNIVGDRCHVHCVLAPGSDPHTYQPKPSDVRAVGAADLCIQNGLHLEGKNWLATLARDAGKPVYTATAGIEALQLDEDGETVADPHAWFSPRLVAQYIRNIVAALHHHDEQGGAQYRARAELYLAQLRSLDSWIRQQCTRIPVTKRILVTSHDAFGYFAHEYGFKNHAPVGWSTGSEIGGGMTPARRRLVVNSIREFAVPAIFVETSVNPRMIREIAREAGVAIGGELFSDSMGERGAAGESYIGMMRENVLNIVSSLGVDPK